MRKPFGWILNNPNVLSSLFWPEKNKERLENLASVMSPIRGSTQLALTGRIWARTPPCAGSSGLRASNPNTQGMSHASNLWRIRLSTFQVCISYLGHWWTRLCDLSTVNGDSDSRHSLFDRTHL